MDRDWRLERAKVYILSTLDSVEVYGYAEPFKGFHYKTYWLTPFCIVKLDTSGMTRLTKKDFSKVMSKYSYYKLKSLVDYGFRLFKAEEIIQSWQEYKWWDAICSREFEKEIVATWEARSK